MLFVAWQFSLCQIFSSMFTNCKFIFLYFCKLGTHHTSPQPHYTFSLLSDWECRYIRGICKPEERLSPKGWVVGMGVGVQVDVHSSQIFFLESNVEFSANISNKAVVSCCGLFYTCNVMIERWAWCCKCFVNAGLVSRAQWISPIYCAKIQPGFGLREPEWNVWYLILFSLCVSGLAPEQSQARRKGPREKRTGKEARKPK